MTCAFSGASMTLSTLVHLSPNGPCWIVGELNKEVSLIGGHYHSVLLFSVFSAVNPSYLMSCCIIGSICCVNLYTPLNCGIVKYTHLINNVSCDLLLFNPSIQHVTYILMTLSVWSGILHLQWSTVVEKVLHISKSINTTIGWLIQDACNAGAEKIKWALKGHFTIFVHWKGTLKGTLCLRFYLFFGSLAAKTSTMFTS